jgi:hypothetical protein
MRYLKHLLLTDTFLMKGHINTGGQRLSSFLSSVPKRFLEMNEVTLVNHIQGECFTTPWMLVRVDEIVLAHELEVAGDEVLRLLAGQDRDNIAVTAHFGGTAPFQVSGKVSKRAIERDTPAGDRDFIVIVEPELRGLMGKPAHGFATFQELPYVIANRSRIAFILP